MAGFNADDLKSRLGLKKEKKFQYTEETISVEREENVNKFFMCNPEYSWKIKLFFWNN